MKNKEKECERWLREHLSKRRLAHVLSVVKEAEKLARMYGADVEKCRLAALLHDAAKEWSLEEMQKILRRRPFPELREEDYLQGEILHGFAAARFVEEYFGIEDAQILEGIAYHTIGKKDLSQLAKIVYIADAIEERRDYPGVQALREATYRSLEEGIKAELTHKEQYLTSLGASLHDKSLEWKRSLEEEENERKRRVCKGSI